MKKSKKIALCGVLSSLAVVIMLMAYIPYMLFAFPAIAGIVSGIILTELDYKWALGTYACTAIIALLLCEKEAAMLFVGVFGYYPIVKYYLERFSSFSNRIREYIFKFAIFNVALVCSYLVIIFLFSIPIENMEVFGRFAYLILVGLANIIFVAYDMALSRVYEIYMKQLHDRVRKLIR